MKYRIVVYRYKRGWSKHRYDTFEVEADPEDSVLDVIERISLKFDRTLVFEHACHHGACGACGMVINGVERLACITKIGEVAVGGTVVVEPLRGFPVISDLAVDKSRMFRHYSKLDIETLEKLEKPNVDLPEYAAIPREKLYDCIECGICYSACPIANTYGEYMGPALLAIAYNTALQTGSLERVKLADSREGVWSCHGAFECSVKCPVDFKPGERIMRFRSMLLGRRLRLILGGGK